MPVVNFLVVFGEIAIGAALILGLVTRFAAVAGGLMMGLFYLAIWDMSHGIVNEQLLLGVTTVFLGVIGAGRYYGSTRSWRRRRPFARHPSSGTCSGDTKSGGSSLTRPTSTSNSGPSGPLLSCVRERRPADRSARL